MAELKRNLGFWSVLALSITGIMGTGTFLGVTLAASIAGKASVVSWLLVFALSMAVAMVFAELSGMYPRAGGLYEFAKQAYGRSVSFITGWTAWLVGNITIVLLIIAGMDYLLSEYASLSPMWVNIIASSVIVLLNIVAIFGVEFSTSIILVLTIVLFGGMMVVLIPAVMHANLANILPLTFKPVNKMLVAFFMLIESVLGWETATYLSEETKNAERTIPRAIIMGAFIVGILMVMIVVAMFGTFGTQVLATSTAPFADLAEAIFAGNAIIAYFITMIIAVNLLGSAASGVVTLPRLLYSMAKDRLFLHHFARINNRTNTPVNATIFQTIVSLVILQIAFGNYDFLLQMLLPLALIIYFFMVIAVPILRFSKPNEKRTFKFPLGRIIPFLISGVFLLLLANWVTTVPNAIKMLLFSFSLIILGIPIYLLLEIYYDPRFITKLNEYFYPIFKQTGYDWMTRNEIYTFVDDFESKTVLEIGSGAGRLTEDLLKKVGKYGTVYATSFSYTELKHLKAKLEKSYDSGEAMGHPVLIHDSQHFTRIPPEVKKVDVIISSGFLAYIQDLDKFLEHASKVMNKTGKIIFVEDINHFHMIPDPEFLSNIKEVDAVFRKHGFSIRIRKEFGLFSNKLIIYGVHGLGQIPFI